MPQASEMRSISRTGVDGIIETVEHQLSSLQNLYGVLDFINSKQGKKKNYRQRITDEETTGLP